MDTLISSLNYANNLMGPLSQDVKDRLSRVVENPTRDNWDDASGIILNRETWITLWQAVCKVDPTFPHVGPQTDSIGRILKDWERIPDSATILRALFYATH